MGHEILEENIDKYLINTLKLEKYLFGKNAKHHLRWTQGSERLGHFICLKKLLLCYPVMRDYIKKYINFSIYSLKEEMDNLVRISNILPQTYPKLTLKRTEFIIKLIELRQRKIQEIINE